jgi:adenine deaminase
LLQGHLNTALKRAVELGYDTMEAIKAVTINPAEHYKLEIGAIQTGKPADIVEVSNLKNLRSNVFLLTESWSLRMEILCFKLNHSKQAK